MMGTAVVAAVTTIVCAVVSGLVAWATTRASAKGSVRAAQVTSLADLEREAGQRASEIYRGAIDQLEREQREDRAELSRLRLRLNEAENDLAECRRACRSLARRFDKKGDTP